MAVYRWFSAEVVNAYRGHTALSVCLPCTVSTSEGVRAVEIKVEAPFIIGSRLMAAYVVEGFATFHIEPMEETDSLYGSRWRYHIIVEEPGGKVIHEDTDLESGVGNDVMLVDSLDNFLGFMGAAGDAYAFEMRNGEGSSENGNLFPADVMEWCYQNSEDLSMAQFNLTYDES